MSSTPWTTGENRRLDAQGRTAATVAIDPSSGRQTAGATGAQRQVGPYRLAERLGEGGMGVVHLGLDERGRAVAVKVLRDHVAHDPSARTRLAREFDTLRRVRHARVAPVLDVDIESEHPYLVTRYVPGPPLDDWVREHGPLGLNHVIRLGRGLAEALDAIHAAGVVHRDLKPGNVLVVDGDPVVIDFGIAHVADDVRLTSTGLVMGTPGYLPPELLDGNDVDEATDWWGWAATLTYAATGRDPFGKGPLDAIFHRVYRGDADLRGVDAPLAALLSRAFDPHPRRRPGFTAIMTALEELRLACAAATPAASNTSAAMPQTQRVEVGGRVTAQVATPGAPPTQVVPSGTASAAAPATRPQPVVATRTLPRIDPPAPAPAGTWAYADFREATVPELSPQPGPAESAGGDGAVPVGPVAGFRPVLRPRSVGAPLIALLAVFVAMAASMPVLACVLAVGWSVLARSVHSSVMAVLLRRETRGHRTSDVPRALAVWPLRVVPATLSTSLVVLLTGVAAVLAALATAAIQKTTYGAANGPAGDLPLAVGMLVGILLGWWGPAGSALRHGSRVTMRALAPGRWGVLVVTVLLWLVAVYFALRSQASGIGASLWPLPAGLLSTTAFGF